MKPLSTLTLRNEETGAVEEYEIQDEQARKTLGEKEKRQINLLLMNLQKRCTRKQNSLQLMT